MDLKIKLEKLQNGDYEAINSLLNEFRTYVPSWIVKYKFTSVYGLEQQDLEQIAICAVYSALQSYDIESNASLKTYAHNAVRYAILTEIRNCQRSMGKEGYVFLQDIFYENDEGKSTNYEELIPGNFLDNPEPYLIRDESLTEAKHLLFKDPVNASIIDLLSKGYDRTEISEILQIPLKEIYNRVYRIKKKAKVDYKH